MNKLERMLKALANRRRLTMVALLRKKKHICVTDVAEALNLSVKATSKHLNILLRAEMVERVQVSLVAFYSLSSPLPPFVKEILTQVSIPTKGWQARG